MEIASLGGRRKIFRTLIFAAIAFEFILAFSDSGRAAARERVTKLKLKSKGYNENGENGLREVSLTL